MVVPLGDRWPQSAQHLGAGEPEPSRLERPEFVCRLRWFDRGDAGHRAAASTVTAKTALLLTALRGAIGEITGTPARDVKVITAMAAASGSDWSKMLVPRSPGSFT